MLDIIINILLVVFVLGILVFVHEFGHFIAARSIGVKVFEFSLGFGPKIIGKKHKGTLYCIRAFPIGGYVKILGDGDPGEEEKVSRKLWRTANLATRSKIQQIYVMLAGVTMNLLLAIFVYYIVLGNSSWKLYVNADLSGFTPVGASIGREKIGDVEYLELKEDGNAEKAGMPSKGEIVSIDGNEVVYSNDISKFIKQKKGQSVDINVCTVEGERICKDYNVQVSDEGVIGIITTSNYVYFVSYAEHKVSAGFSHLVNNVKLMGMILSNMFVEAKSTGDYSDLSNSVSGPIGMYYVLSSFKNEGIITLLGVVADLSLSLAIMNILPIPALDGGRVFILFLEGLIRKDLSKNVESAIINISFIFLMLLTVAVMVKDIVNINEIKSMFG